MVLGEIIGWYGTISILIGYILISYNIIKNGYIYQLINLTGSLALVYISLTKDATQLAVLNTVFITIALTAIIKFGLKDFRHGRTR